MAITSEQQSDILKVVAGLFNAAPGGSNLSDLASQVDGGVSVQQLADGLAAHPTFTNGVMAGKVTTAAQTGVLLGNFGLAAGNADATSADAQAEAFFTSQIDAGVGFGAIVYEAVTFLSGTVGSEFTETQTLLNNKVLVSEAFSASSSSDDLSELQNVLSNVTGTAPFTQADVDAALDDSGSSGTGQTFTLTTGTDNVIGTSSNDTIIGELTPLVSIDASDQINGGSGTDTFKIFGAFTGGTSATGVLSNIETLFVANVAAAAQNFTTLTKAGQGIEMIEIDNASLLTGHTITTTTGQTLSLSTGSANGATAGAVTWAGPVADASLNLYLNGYQGGVGVTPAAFTATGALATTVNINSIGASNATGTFTGPTSTLDHVITGDQKFTYALAAADAAALNGIDASGNTAGGVNVNTTAATTKAAFTFVGGAGDDSITVADNNLGSLTAGSQLDGGAGTKDKLGIFDTALTAAETTAINAALNFEVLGLNAAITLDGSSLTSVQSFAIDTAALTDVITNMATGANVALNASSTAQTYSGAVGVNDLSIDIGSGTNAAITSTALTIGQTAVALSSNGVTGTTNVITTLANADNSVYTVTGSAGLTITNATAATATGTKFDGSAMTGALTIVGNATAFATGSGLGDIIIGGSVADTITSSVNGATMTGNGGADNFNVSVALGGISATAMLPTVTDFTKGDILTFGATAGAFTAAKVDLSGAANVAAALDLLAAGSNSDLKWGNFGGNTYVVDDVDAGATFAATDTGVVLTGTLDLSTSTFAANAITFV